MPNHCDNELRVYGPKAERERFWNGLFKAEEGRHEDEGGGCERPLKNLSILDTYDPVPACFEGICSGGATIDGIQVREWRSVGGKDQRIPEEELTRMRHLHGATNGYNWCIEHWGTKWGDYDHADPVQHRGNLFFRFYSAWSAPVDGIRRVSLHFPKLKFELKYWERGMGFQGGATIRNGEIEDDWFGSYSGSRGG